MIDDILPAWVATAEEFADPPHVTLFPEEEALITRAADKRRHEFRTSRHCAHRALLLLDMTPQPILRGDRGAPAWPPGITGSITHCPGYRAAAVARDALAIGIDAEPYAPAPEGILHRIATPTEIAALHRTGLPTPDRLLFSAKEAIYKTWFPLTGHHLTFRQATVTFTLSTPPTLPTPTTTIQPPSHETRPPLTHRAPHQTANATTHPAPHQTERSTTHSTSHDPSRPSTHPTPHRTERSTAHPTPHDTPLPATHLTPHDTERSPAHVTPHDTGHPTGHVTPEETTPSIAQLRCYPTPPQAQPTLHRTSPHPPESTSHRPPALTHQPSAFADHPTSAPAPPRLASTSPTSIYATGTFEAEIAVHGPGWPTHLSGRWLISNGLIVTAIVIRAPGPAARSQP
ncbi:4'-phosphopantetheinyl transferase superfamily protein [Nonomuraea sp. NPDC050643]|uniref:4'-phosphopantetheinyl transferase family protein n=1 Tax=Nonomuraea sp. NPDC050643 TaxID=3155660 RepID=UPI0034098B72